jgi:hypothetical protein
MLNLKAVTCKKFWNKHSVPRAQIKKEFEFSHNRHIFKVNWCDQDSANMSRVFLLWNSKLRHLPNNLYISFSQMWKYVLKRDIYIYIYINLLFKRLTHHWPWHYTSLAMTSRFSTSHFSDWLRWLQFKK